jgi:hypothetical protein
MIGNITIYYVGLNVVAYTYNPSFSGGRDRRMVV